MPKRSQQPPADELDHAVAAALAAPHDSTLWENLETLGTQSDRPAEVLAAFRHALSGESPPELADVVGQRATAFCEAWLADEPESLRDILGRVLAIDPTVDWAFQKLTFSLTVAERWDELWRVYDRAIAAADGARRETLLEEAAQVAKDVAQRPELAADYLVSLSKLRPSDGQVAASLTRLLEKAERWRDLVEVSEARLAVLKDGARGDVRADVAALWLDRLGDPARALAQASALLEEAPEHPRASEILERIVASPDAAPADRDAALALLRARLGEQDVVRVLEVALATGTEAARARRHRELAARMIELGEHKGAIAHLADLLVLEPTSRVVQEQLAELCARADDLDAYAGALTRAADTASGSRKVSLFAAAAQVRDENLGERDAAIALCEAALGQPEIQPHEIASVGRRLDALLAAAGRDSERVVILEKLAAAEPSVAIRAALIGEAARLSEAAGDVSRARALWERRHEADPADRVALDEIIRLAQAAEDWPATIAHLRKRADRALSPAAATGDLARAAEICDRELGDAQGAVAIWRELAAAGGEDQRVVDALSRLLSQSELFADHAELLTRASQRDTERVCAELAQLADLSRRALGDPAGAATTYRAILRIDPAQKSARQGLRELLEDPEAPSELRANATAALADACRHTGDDAGYVALLSTQLELAHSDAARLELWREAAVIYERQGEVFEAAAALAQALPLAPRDRALAARVTALCEAAEDFSLAARAFRAAAEAVADDRAEAARLLLGAASLFEDKLDAKEDALACFSEVRAAEPENRLCTIAVVRLAGSLGQWDRAAAAMVDFIARTAAADDDLYSVITAAAEAGRARPEMVSAMTRAADAAEGADARTNAALAELWHRIGSWHRDILDDREAAEAALARAIAFDPGRLATLRALAELRAPRTDASLVETLARIAHIDAADIDAAYRAAKVALSLGDPGLARERLGHLLGAATTAWRRRDSRRFGEDQLDAEACARWAAENLADLASADGDHTAAIDTLVDAARLPFAEDTRSALRLRAADIAATRANDPSLAIELIRAVLAARPGDTGVMARLGDIYRDQGRQAELLELCRHELDADPPPERRLALRLEIARITGTIEDRGDRIEALTQNLADAPGHAESIDALCMALRSRARHAELYDVLTAQADTLERRGDAARGGELWALAARLAEAELADPERATEAYRRACAARPEPTSLEALARLYEAQDDPERAARWLEARLELESGQARTAIALRLARAHVGAGNSDRAAAVLAAALADDPGSVEARDALAEIYRAEEANEALAQLLTEGLPHAQGPRALTDATEAVALFRKIGTPDRAIPALEHALAVYDEESPERRPLRGMLAEALLAAGRAADAEAILRELTDSFGRRRTPERAAAHVELARAIRAQGRLEDAATELAVATKMDAGNPLVMRESAQLAREREKFDDAERQYRALLLVVRRRADMGEDAVGASEVLYELSRLARARGDESQAADLCESALAEARKSDLETRRLGRALRAAGEHQLLHRALEARLGADGDGKSRIDLFTEIAQVRAEHLDDGAGALTAMIDALALDPTSERVLGLARERATAVTGGAVRFAEACGDLAGGLRRKDEQDVAAQLYLAAGAALEADAGDLEAAQAMYDKAQATGGRPAEAFTALARVARARGDEATQARAFEALSEIAEQAPLADRADALYQLAELQIDVAERREAAVEIIRQALAAQPMPARAAAMLARAAADDPDNPEVMSLYQQTARASGQPGVILDALVLRARQDDAAVVEIQEAAKLALSEEDSRADEMLELLAERAGDAGVAGDDTAWAGAALAERALVRGDFDTAREHWQRTLDSGELADAMKLGLAIAERAAASADSLPVACTIYEALREREPTARAIWQPLLAAYRELGDSDRLASVIAATLPNLVDPGERNVLRMEHATFLKGRGEIDGTIETLRDVLLDEPGNTDASVMMEKVLVTAGRDDELADFLAQQFEDARERRDSTMVPGLGVRLGALAEKRDDLAEAITVYRAAMALCPDDREVLAALTAALAKTDADVRERAEVSERLLAVEAPERAGRLAGKVASLWSELDDVEAVERVLALGHARAPDDEALQSRLEGFYRDRGRWASLAELIAEDARRQTDATRAVERLREAASLMSAKLENPTRAASLLGEAHELAPDDDSLLGALTSTLSAAGNPRGAAESLAAAIERASGDARAELLSRRADFWLAAKEGQRAIGDLEEARNLAPAEMTAKLRAALEAERTRAAQSGDNEIEREVTLKLLPLLMEAGDADQSRELLVGWLDRVPDDRDALFTLRDLELASERWAGVVRACERLVAVTEGEEQIEAALALCRAADELSEPALARTGLETACRAQPGASELGAKLREIYEAAGAFGDLGRLSLADADAAETDAERFAALSRAAAMFIRDGDASAALDPARRAYALSPEDHDAIILASDALTAAGQVDEAVTILEPAIAAHKRRSPKLGALLRRMAHVTAVRGDREAQLGWLKKAFDVDRKNGELAAELAHLATELGDYDLALKPLRAISLMENPGPITRVMALLWEAKIEHARGNRAKAELWAKKALREDPDYEDAKTFLAEISDK